MTNPQDDPQTLARVYTVCEDKIYEGEFENRERGALRHLALIRDYHPGAARLLDVGCATGIFVGVAQKEGWETTGIDASEWMVACGRTRCPGATFQVGVLEEASLAPGGFDVITLWDVLEHVSSPLETVRRVGRWLAPGGWVFFSMPNAASMSSRLMGRHWPLLLREHLWYFSPNTIGALLSRAGFGLVETRPKLVEFSIANILGRLAQYPGMMRGICEWLSRRAAFRRVRVRFPMGEMYVVARVREK
jgi:SAM-dependent methyltransferase